MGELAGIIEILSKAEFEMKWEEVMLNVRVILGIQKG